VTLDLGGFSMISNCDASCNPFTSGISTSDLVSGISIRNGFVQGFYTGISGGNLIEKITARSNIDLGIGTFINIDGEAADAAMIRDSSALNNGGDGIAGGLSVMVSDCVATGNGANGIDIESGTIRGSLAANNHLNGIKAGNPGPSVPHFGSTITGNTTINNGQAGIHLSSTDGSTVTTNSSNRNQGNGFDAGPATGTTFTGNTAVFNGGIGFNVNCPSNLIGNTAVGNNIPDVEGGIAGACNNSNNVFH
jgi:hypothetical protein